MWKWVKTFWHQMGFIYNKSLHDSCLDPEFRERFAHKMQYHKNKLREL